MSKAAHKESGNASPLASPLLKQSDGKYPKNPIFPSLTMPKPLMSHWIPIFGETGSAFL
jgi:hypothetical protein